MVYRSSKDAWSLALFFFLIFLGAFLAIYYIYLVIKGLDTFWGSLVNIVIGLFTVVFLTSYLVRTNYEFDDENKQLIIRNGFFSERIKYKEILELEEKRKWFGFSSLSTQKLKIKVGAYRNTGNHTYLYISPTPKDEFIAHLKEVTFKLKVIAPPKKKEKQ